MSRVLWLVVASLLAALPRAAAAQEMARLLPEEADIYTSGAGLVRLPLPPAVLAACTPDLADLRVFDRNGREVPYLVDPGVPSGLERRERMTTAARVTDLEREEIPREHAKSATREIYRIAMPAKAPPDGAWVLAFTSSQPRFVRRVSINGIAPDGSREVLVPRASLVRLGQKLVDRDRVPLPSFAGAAIEVTIEGEEGAFLEPELRFESERKIAPAGRSQEPLEVLGQRREKNKTILDVSRPPVLASADVRLDTETPVFDRTVTVYDVSANGSSTRLGSGRVTRAPTPGARVEQLEVGIAPARGERLRIEIDDGDSPPLEGIRPSYIYSQPALLFALPTAPADQPAGVLRLGGNRAYAPRYDVDVLLRDATAASAELLADPSTLPAARLGPVRPNPQFDAAPALRAVMYPGGQLEIDEWRWQRPLQFPDSPEGLVRVRLAPEDLAQAQPDHADLRVVDAQGRQWPYVLAPATERASMTLSTKGPTTKDGASHWPLELPVRSLLVDRIDLHSARPVLSRPYKLVTHDERGKERVLAQGTLAQDLRRPGPLSITFAPAWVEDLELVVEDGDDAPLELTRIEAPVALPSLLVAAPAGDYKVLAGNPDAARPQYEIERARDVVLDLRSISASSGEGVESASWSGVSGGQRRLLQQVAIWGAIVLAVAVLAFLTLRMARGGPGGGKAPDA